MCLKSQWPETKGLASKIRYTILGEKINWEETKNLVKEIQTGAISSNVFKKAVKWAKLSNVWKIECSDIDRWLLRQGRLSDFEH